MTRQIRTTLLTGLFFFGLLTGLQAQDKYEFAVVQYRVEEKTLYISFNSKDFQSVKANKDDVKNFRDFRPLLDYVSTMTNDGWELINSQFDGTTQAFFTLSRKAKN